MANLSAYINFAIVLDNSITPAKIKFLDTSNYPGGVAPGISGVVEIQQPDGIIVTGNVVYSGGVLTSPLLEFRMGANGQPQNGGYRIKYTINHASYDTTILERVLQLAYTEPVGSLVGNINTFAPLLTVTDATNYVVSNLTLQNVTRSWSGIVGTLGNISGGNTQTFDLALGGQYYDADYSITLVAIAEWVLTNYTWATLKDKIARNNTFSADTPPSLQELLAMLDAYKTQLDQSSSCNSNQEDLYAYALALYQHIITRGSYGQTAGLDAYIWELVRILNGGTLPTYVNTEFPIIPFNWTTPTTGGGIAYTAASIGNGKAVYATTAGTQFRFKSLVQGSGVTLTETATEIVIDAATGDVTDATNVGTNGVGLYIDKAAGSLRLRKLFAGSGISINTLAGGEIQISAPGLGEVNVGGNLGTGAQIYKDKVGPTLRFKTLKQGANVLITETADEVTISATGGAGGSGEANTASNEGVDGVGLFIEKDGVNLKFRKIIGGNGVTVTQLANPREEVQVNGPGMANVGIGASIYKDLSANVHRFKKLKQGANVTITENTDDITISASGGGGGGSLPTGGVAGQVLTKLSSTDGDASWDDPATLPEQIVALMGTMY